MVTLQFYKNSLYSSACESTTDSVPSKSYWLCNGIQCQADTGK